MSIAILAKKIRAQRVTGSRTGWTLATTKSGKCGSPCGGGAPLKQKSMRQLMTDIKNGGGPQRGGLRAEACCRTTWKEVVNSKGNQSASQYLWKKKQLTHNCIHHCLLGRTDISNNIPISHCLDAQCNHVGCECHYNKSLGGKFCCTIHKDLLPLTISENIPWIVERNTCLHVTKPPPTNRLC